MSYRLMEAIRAEMEEIYASKLESLAESHRRALAERDTEVARLRGRLEEARQLMIEFKEEKEELERYKREKEEQSSARRKEGEEEGEGLLLQAMKIEYESKYRLLEEELFASFQRETEDLVDRVGREMEEILRDRGVTRERREELEEEVRQELREGMGRQGMISQLDNVIAA